MSLKQYKIKQEHKKILIHYLYSFIQASYFRYNRANLNDLYTYEMPLYLKSVNDFNFQDLRTQKLYEQLFLTKQGLKNFSYFVDSEHYDFQYESENNVFRLYFFTVEEQHFAIQIQVNNHHSELFLITPKYLDYIENDRLEENLFVFLSVLKNYLLD